MCRKDDVSVLIKLLSFHPPQQSLVFKSARMRFIEPNDVKKLYAKNQTLHVSSRYILPNCTEYENLIVIRKNEKLFALLLQQHSLWLLRV